MNRDEFLEIVKRFRPALQRVIRRYVHGQEHHVEDLLQEALCRGWQHRERLRDPQAAGAWLLRIAERVALSSVCREVRQARASRVLRDETEQVCAADPAWPAMRDKLLAAIARLPEMQRTVLLMQVFCGLDLTEISLRTGESIASIKSLLFRARQHLRAHLCGNDDMQ